MRKHNMSGMDAASKLLMSNKAVARDALNFVLRNSGYTVVEGSMQLRNPEAIAKLHGLKNLYKKISNDVVWELDVTNGGPPVRLLAEIDRRGQDGRRRVALHDAVHTLVIGGKLAPRLVRVLRLLPHREHAAGRGQQPPHRHDEALVRRAFD